MPSSAPFSIRHPLRLLLIWAVVVAAMMAAITVYPRIRANPTFKSMIMTNDPDRSLNQQAKEIFGNDEMIVVAVENPHGVFNLPTLKFIDQITRGCEAIEGVRKVYSLTRADDIRGRDATLVTDDLITTLPTTQAEVDRIERDAFANPTYVNNIVAPDKKVAGINVELWLDHNSPAEQGKITQQIYKVVHDAGAHPPPGVKTYVTGFPVAAYMGGVYMNRDMQRFGMAAIFVLILLMGFVLRTWQGVVGTILVVVCSIVVTYGTMSIVGVEVTMPLSALANFLVALGMEYTTFVAFSYNTQTHIDTRIMGAPPADRRGALARGLQSVWGGMLLSAFTTVVGFLSLWTSAVPDVKLMGLFLALGTTVAVIAAMTIVPALTALRPYTVRPEPEQHRRLQRMLERICRIDVKRPRLVVVIFGLSVVAGLLMMTRLSADADATDYFKKDDPVRTATEFVRHRMGGDTYLMAVVTADKVDAFKEPANLAKLDQVARYAEGLPHVTKATSQADYIKLMNRALHGDDPAAFKLPRTKAAVEQYLLLHNEPDDFRLTMDPDYRRANIMLRLDTMGAVDMTGVEKSVESFMKKTFPEYDSNVVATTLLVHRAFTSLSWSTVTSLASGGLVIWVILIIFFRSFKLGTLVLIPNLAPALLVYAFLPLVGRPLDVPTSGTGAIALGIAVDDTTHFFKTWLAKAKAGTCTDVSAIQETFAEMGQPIVMSSMVLGLGFSILTLSNYGALVWTGIMMAVVMAIQLLWDLFFTPAMLRMVGVGKKADTK